MAHEKSKWRRWWLVPLIAGGVILSAVAVFGIVLTISIATARHKAVRQGNETAATLVLKTIIAKEQEYYEQRKSYTTFADLYAAGLIDVRLSHDPAILNQYIFTLRVVPAQGDQKAFYTITAEPEITSGYGANGWRHFYVDSRDWVIHFAQARPAGPDDPVQ